MRSFLQMACPPRARVAGEHFVGDLDAADAVPSPASEPDGLRHDGIGAAEAGAVPNSAADPGTHLTGPRVGGHRRRDGQSQPAGMGAAAVNPAKITTLKRWTSEMPEFNLDHWWVAPFSEGLCRSPFVQGSFTCLWQQSETIDPFLVWYNPQLFVDLECSDMLDDHEFFKTVAAGISFLNSSDILSNGARNGEKKSNNAERTRRPQKENNAGRTQVPQESDNSAERTQVPQELAGETLGLQRHGINFDTFGAPLN